MKKYLFSVSCLLVLTSYMFAQDTLYVYKSGAVISKCAVNDLDSMSFTYTPPATGTVTDIDGNIYHWITIGTQTWMVENLKTTKFRTGESVSNISDATAWGSATFSAWCNYNNDATNGNKYGKLYNWYAVNDSRKIAPLGWHIASDAEWSTLINYVSTHLSYSTSAAKAIAANTDWISFTGVGIVGSDLSINNSSLFTALPGGFRRNDGNFWGLIGHTCDFWTSTQYDASSALFYALYFSFNTIDKAIKLKQSGLSVRCIKD